MNRVLIVLCLGLLACGEIIPIGENGDGGSTVDGGSGSTVDGGGGDICTGPSIAVENIEECFLKTQCQQMVRCLPGFPNAQFCEERLFDFFALVADDLPGDDSPSPLMFESFRVAAAKDGITFHGENAFKCLDAMSKSCTRDQQVPECELLLTGSLAPGNSCYEDFECQAGAYCDSPASQVCSDTAQGVCVMGLGLGDNCQISRCRPELNCVRLEGSASCENGSGGSPCSENKNCKPGLYCDANQCTPQKQSGANCEFDEQCVGDDFCVGTICSAADSVNDECDGACLGNLYCNEMSLCQAMPSSGEGCAATGGKIPCDSVDFLCDPGMTTCQPRHDDGNDCGEGSNWCALGTFCTSEIGDNSPSCSERLPDNDRCSSHNHCQSGFCDFSRNLVTCQPANFCWL